MNVCAIIAHVNIEFFHHIFHEVEISSFQLVLMEKMTWAKSTSSYFFAWNM